MNDKYTAVKSHKLNEASFPEHTLIQYKIFELCIAKYNNLFNKSDLIEITAKECIEKLNADNNIYKELKNFKDILGKKIIIKHDDNYTYTDLYPLSFVEYNSSYANLKIKFNDDAKLHIGDLKDRFVMISIKSISEFGSIYSTRLYEFMTQFKNTGYIRKSVEDLAFILGYKFDTYGHFNLCLKRAINEIMEIKGLKINVKEIKPSRKVIGIELTFNLSKIKIKEKAQNKKIKPENKLTTDDIPF